MMKLLEQIGEVPFSIHLPEGMLIQGHYNTQKHWNHFPFPPHFRDRSFLDIGKNFGSFAYEAVRLKAKHVVAASNDLSTSVSLLISKQNLPNLRYERLSNLHEGFNYVFFNDLLSSQRFPWDEIKLLATFTHHMLVIFSVSVPGESGKTRLKNGQLSIAGEELRKMLLDAGFKDTTTPHYFTFEPEPNTPAVPIPVVVVGGFRNEARLEDFSQGIPITQIKAYIPPDTHG